MAMAIWTSVVGSDGPGFLFIESILEWMTCQMNAQIKSSRLRGGWRWCEPGGG